MHFLRSWMKLWCCKHKWPQYEAKFTESRTLALQKKYFICFTEIPLKLMENPFYFILKALSVFKIFKFLFGLFGHVEKAARLKK